MPEPARAKGTTIKTLLLEERLRHPARELSVERGSQRGSQLDVWLQAEQQSFTPTRTHSSTKCLKRLSQPAITD